MKIYKFGGASVKDASAIANVAHVIKSTFFNEGVIVVSAIGKTTNALEEVVKYYMANDESYKKKWNDIILLHTEILKALAFDPSHIVYQIIQDEYESLLKDLSGKKYTDYNELYDRLVSTGEILSTLIISNYLNKNDIINEWIDARLLIATDHTYRDAQVNWERTTIQILNKINPNNIYVTQGFIGATPEGNPITLGREGSDYSAAIFAYAMDAESVTIWKDVPGVLNADPRYFENTTLLQQISYKEAIEMAFYGASVIHPKTLQPLQNKQIPLYVKSFVAPQLPGTSVSLGATLIPQIPTYILKKGLWLVSFSSKDFSFIMEKQLSQIFEIFAKYHIKVNLIQNTAISFSVCIEDKFEKFQEMMVELKDKFKITYNENVNLYTVRHFTEINFSQWCKNEKVLLQQQNRDTLQFVTQAN